MKQLLLGLTLLPFFSVAQNVEAGLDRAAHFNRYLIKELPLPPPEQKGSFYLNENWEVGNVVLKNEAVIKSYPIRYDLKHNYLEINVAGSIKVCALALLKNFSYLSLDDSIVYYNTYSIYNDKTMPDGICQLLIDDQIQLINYQFLAIIKSNYNEALDIGERNQKTIKKTQLYVIVRNEVFEVKGSLKGNRNIFLDQITKVKAYMKTNKLKFNSIGDITKIFEYYNQII
ncbi:MAG TPA: hypothetical protein PKL31_16335 [Fulvivirga sp.]|nr:hypothetical protein [Fulvivirga sp.]